VHKAKRRIDWYVIAKAWAAQAQYRMLQWSPLRRQAELTRDRDRRIVERKLDVGTRTRRGRTPRSSAARAWHASACASPWMERNARF
jgi:hypothetical protein